MNATATLERTAQSIVTRPCPKLAAPRPRCASCGKPGPTINGHCVPHMDLATEVWLYTVSAEDASAS